MESGLEPASVSDEPPVHAQIDTIVTVVDAVHFLTDLASSETLAERGIAAPDHDDRTVGEVVIEQVEFCDVIVINHADRADETALERLRHVLAKINPRAAQIVTQFGDVEIDAVVDARRFDFEAAASAPGWLMALEHDAGSLVDDDAFGVGMFVYRARRPFHPARLFALLHQEWQGVLRSKGYFWLASRHDMAGTLSQVGGTCRHGPAGYWWAAQPPSEWPDDAAFKAEIEADWFSLPDADGVETIGDRRQELVMIGIDLDREAWQRAFDACLLDDAELYAGSDAWAAFDDPFPQWDEDHDHEHDHDDGYERHDHDDHDSRHAHARSHDHAQADDRSTRTQDNSGSGHDHRHAHDHDDDASGHRH
ncbi:GTP-binding protein [Pararobbsia silviterrae]|uniref:GTP-binding protein n=1 Tax=Pararobbsia silviterrae TaxID=1792498 RepID=UPI003B83539D